MEHGPYDLEKQQRMLLRSIADIQRHILHALETKVTHDFEIVQTSVGHLKTFVEEHVTAPEIRVYASQIKNIVHVRGASRQFKLFGIRWGQSKSNEEYPADRVLLRGTEEIRAKLGNLEILVRMMGDD